MVFGCDVWLVCICFKIEINKPEFVKIPVVLISTVLVFITMIAISNINQAITIQGISGVLASYVLNNFFIYSYLVDSKT